MNQHTNLIPDRLQELDPPAAAAGERVTGGPRAAALARLLIGVLLHEVRTSPGTGTPAPPAATTRALDSLDRHASYTLAAHLT